MQTNLWRLCPNLRIRDESNFVFGGLIWLNSPHTFTVSARYSYLILMWSIDHLSEAFFYLDNEPSRLNGSIVSQTGCHELLAVFSQSLALRVMMTVIQRSSLELKKLGCLHNSMLHWSSWRSSLCWRRKMSGRIAFSLTTASLDLIWTRNINTMLKLEANV